MSAFDKIIGYRKEKEELTKLCDMLRNPERYLALGAKLPRGLLISGAPGLGKTLMAHCFMEEVGWKSYTVRRSKPDGDFVRELSRVFQEAAEHAPAIILLDDMDKFVVEERSDEEYVAVQAGIDDVAGKDVYVIATANDLDDIPASLLRAGRFDRKIEMGVPKGKDAEDIIRFYLQGKCLEPSVSLTDVAKMLGGSSCAELETMLNEAAICAGYQGCEHIDMAHIVEVVLRDEYGVGEDRNTGDSQLRWRIAYHEAGHAVMLELLRKGGVGLVSVRSAQSDHGGFMRACECPNTEEENVLISLAGFIATELKYGIRDAGGAEDLQKAKSSIRRDINSRGLYGTGLMESRRIASDALLSQQEVVAGAEMERYLTITRTILSKNLEFLDALAGELYEKGTLLNSDVARIRAQYRVCCLQVVN